MQNNYDANELKSEYAFLQSRQTLGQWKQEECPSVQGSINRITWVLNGSYGRGAQLLAQQIIKNHTENKVGKNLDKAWLAVGRELTILVSLHDTTEYTARKITEVWKKQGVDFLAINSLAAQVVKDFIANEEG